MRKVGTKINLAEYDLEPMDALDLKGRPIFQVKRENVKRLIRGLGKAGEVVSVTFRKQPKKTQQRGDIRKMTGRFGCHRKAVQFNKTGENRNTHANFPQYERIFETNLPERDVLGRFRVGVEGQFRTFNLDTLTTIRGKDHVFVVVGNPCYAEQEAPKLTDREIAEQACIAQQMRR